MSEELTGRYLANLLPVFPEREEVEDALHELDGARERIVELEADNRRLRDQLDDTADLAEILIRHRDKGLKLSTDDAVALAGVAYRTAGRIESLIYGAFGIAGRLGPFAGCTPATDAADTEPAQDLYDQAERVSGRHWQGG